MTEQESPSEYVALSYSMATQARRFSFGLSARWSRRYSPNTLSTRLQNLTEAGLRKHEAYDEVPPRVEYTLTGKAESLFPVFT
jgi:DNA-binding HxlR family transcriptional regulator